MLNRGRDGGQGPLDRGKQQLGGVRLWALTGEEEYYADPVPTNVVVILEGGDADADGRRTHCCARWAALAERVLPCSFPPGEADGTELEPAAELPPDLLLSDSADRVDGEDSVAEEDEEEEHFFDADGHDL
eukprot:SAG31_NODE_15673_length_743_cov_1.273292_1_plen_130_part_10